MDFEKMSLDELKEYAKSKNITVGNIGREKLIERIKEKESESNIAESVFNDMVTQNESSTKNDFVENKAQQSLAESISSAIDDLDDSCKYVDTNIEDLPINTQVRVKSITYGGLTYKSRTSNAIYRWNQIGAEEIMTISELNEMNNHKRDFLNRPLVILMDDRAIKKFRLTKVYENVAKINDLVKIFNTNNFSLIESTIDTALAVNMKDILISKTSQLIKNKVLVDINIIRLLSRKLKYEFEEILEEVDLK